MKRRFILLDQSIEDSTGHYLEYARRVMRAAKEKGFRTVLAVNKRAGEIECPDADVIDKTFSRTYWENQVQNRAAIVLWIARGGREVGPDARMAQQFADEFCSLTQRIEVTSGDLVFVPTLGSVELIGIALYSTLTRAKALQWHLLLRRDLPNPKSVLHAKEYVTQRRATSAFNEFGKRFDKGGAFFYTDTEALTAQYNRLEKFHFNTLPIPIDDSLCSKKTKDGAPLIVSYLGDAREEKGFHLLPKLIKDVRAAGFGEDRATFRIQVNLPRAGISARVLHAKNNLTRRQGLGLQLLEGPFDSKTYHELISSSDIILVPYYAKSYRTRSSGIFAEALAAGVPTIYPRGTWMESCHHDSGSVGFSRAADMPSALIDLVSHYPEYESRSRNYSHIWRQIHSARRLIDSLTNQRLEIEAPGEAKLCGKDALGHVGGSELRGRNTDII